MTVAKIALSLLALTLTTTLLVSCGSDDENSASAGVTYGGPGSDYRIAIVGSSVSITESTSGLNVSGTLSSLATGFSEIELTTVTNAGGTGAVVGDSLYALVIPGVVTLLKPAGTEQLVTAVPIGACPTADIDLNWISTKLNDPTTEDLFGSFSYDHASNTANITGFLASEGAGDTSPSVNNSVTPLNCSGGIATPTGATMYLTQSGGAIAKLDQGAGAADDRFVVAMPSTISASGDLDGNYAGLIFTEDDGSHPAHATFNGATLSITTVNPDTGAAVAPLAVAETLTIANFNGNGIGVFHGTLSGGEEVRCISDEDVNSSGKNFVFCVGQAPGGTADDVFNALFISR